MEFEKNKDQLDLFLSEADEALDIVAMIIDQMGHTQTIDDVRRNQQTNVWLQKLYEHPSYKAAVARKIKRHWDLIEKTAKEVDSWPVWMKGHGRK